MVIGGYGGGSSVEVITKGEACVSSSSIPNIPNAPAGQIEGWCAEYLDGKIWLCGGADLNFHSECYSSAPGASYWETVRKRAGKFKQLKCPDIKTFSIFYALRIP